MNKKIISLMLMLFLCFSLLCSCSPSHKSKGDETTVPLDTLLEAIDRNDADKYKSAFPPDYISRLTEELKLIKEDTDKKIKENIKNAIDAREMNYGGKNYAFYILMSKTPLDIEALCDSYNDYYIQDYKLKKESITEAYSVNVILNVGGSDRETQDDASFVFIKQDGVWYLHPKFFLYTV